MTPGDPAVCFGTVMHHRLTPVDHRFSYPTTLIWIDPDHPDDLCRHHRLWSATRPAPVRFRRRDYLDGSTRALSAAVRGVLAAELGRAPNGPIRMLTQPRTWGWLFNPITIYLAWDADEGGDGDTNSSPVAAVLEVTNTPWKERHLYAVALEPTSDGEAGGRVGASFDKALHVSPFLGLDYRYRLAISTADAPVSAAADPPLPAPRRYVPSFLRGLGAQPAPIEPQRRMTVDLDVLEPARIQQGVGDELTGISLDGRVVLATRLTIDQFPVERAVLTQAIRNHPLPTHRVSFGIHHQALRLWRRGVPFVAHPKRRSRAADGGRTR